MRFITLKPLYQTQVEDLWGRSYTYTKACEIVAKKFRRETDDRRHHKDRVRDLTKNPKKSSKRRKNDQR